MVVGVVWYDVVFSLTGSMIVVQSPVSCESDNSFVSWKTNCSFNIAGSTVFNLIRNSRTETSS